MCVYECVCEGMCVSERVSKGGTGSVSECARE